MQGSKPPPSEGCGVVFKLSLTPNHRWKYGVLYRFNFDQDENWDGCYPSSPVVMDGPGNFYGTTLEEGEQIQGTVYEIIS